MHIDSAYLTSEVIREDHSVGHHLRVFDGRWIVRTQGSSYDIACAVAMRQSRKH